MGLFSSDYVTTVGTTVSRVVQDKAIIPSSKTGLIAALFGEDGDQLVENVLESMATGLGVRGERLYAYAKAKYPHGLPMGKVALSTDGKEAVIQQLKTLTASNIVVDYYHFGPLNNLHVGWLRLVTEYGYDSITNKLNTLSLTKGFPVYLKDLVVVVQEATLDERANGSLDQWGKAANAGFTPARPVGSVALQEAAVPTPFRADPTAVNADAVMLSYTWEYPVVTIITPEKSTTVNGVVTITPAVTSTQKVIKTEEVLLPITGYDRTKDFFQIKYFNGSKAGYWLYQLGAGTYLGIDRIFSVTSNALGEFFPFVYFRQDKKNLGAVKTTPEYKASKRMMKLLGIDYQDTLDAIHGDGPGAQKNPDIDKVEQALMMFAVSPSSQNQVDIQYLYAFFDKLYIASGGVGVGTDWDIGTVGSGTVDYGESTREQSAEEVAMNKLLERKEASNIRITIQDKKLNTGLSCKGIFKRKKAGIVAAVGKYAASFEKSSTTYTYTTRSVVGYEIPNDVNSEPVYANTSHTLVQPTDLFKYRLQITDNIYEEIVVYDLKFTYYMYGGYSTIGDDKDAILLVPLDHAITSTYPLIEREELYARSLHYVFNSRVITEVKWYQQAWFGDFITAVGLILTVLSLGADGGFFASAAAAVAAGVEAVALFVLKALVQYVVMDVAMRLFVKTLGAEFTFLVALVAMAYGGYKSYTAGSIQGAPWAQELLQLGNGLASAVSASMADAMTGLQKEYEEFSLLSKEKTTLLEDANKLLDQQSLLSPLVIFGESPNDFYNRTVHAGNIGILGIDSIASFVDIALTLPKLNDTLEGNSYG